MPAKRVVPTELVALAKAAKPISRGGKLPTVLQSHARTVTELREDFNSLLFALNDTGVIVTHEPGQPNKE